MGPVNRDHSRVIADHRYIPRNTAFFHNSLNGFYIALFHTEREALGMCIAVAAVEKFYAYIVRIKAGKELKKALGRGVQKSNLRELIVVQYVIYLKRF